jgi:hypothetical protein
MILFESRAPSTGECISFPSPVSCSTGYFESSQSLSLRYATIELTPTITPTRYTRHKRGDNAAASRLLDQAHVENPTATGLVQRFAVLRAAASRVQPDITSPTPQDNAGPAVSHDQSGSTATAAATLLVEQTFLVLAESTLMTPKHLNDAVQIALEGEPIGTDCLMSGLQALRARCVAAPRSSSDLA